MVSSLSALWSLLLHVSFISFIAASPAVDNLFLDEEPSASLNSVPLVDFNAAALDPPYTFENQPSIFNDQSFTLGDVQTSSDAMSSIEWPVLDEDRSSDKSPTAEGDQLWASLPDNDASLTVALDDCSTSQNPDIISKRIKSRNNAACNVKRPAVYLPDNFRELDRKLQDKIFQEYLCPTSDIMLYFASIPICSSRLLSNTKLSDFGENDYELKDSIPLTWTDISYCVYPRQAFCCLRWSLDSYVGPDGLVKMLGSGTGFHCSRMIWSWGIFPLLLPPP